jgi:hypothetical protein
MCCVQMLTVPRGRVGVARRGGGADQDALPRGGAHDGRRSAPPRALCVALCALSAALFSVCSLCSRQTAVCGAARPVCARGARQRSAALLALSAALFALSAARFALSAALLALSAALLALSAALLALSAARFALSAARFALSAALFRPRGDALQGVYSRDIGRGNSREGGGGGLRFSWSGSSRPLLPLPPSLRPLP